jgi:type VI secretion system secreted protein VgrG
MAHHNETINTVIEVDGTAYDLVRSMLYEQISVIGALVCEVTLTGGPPEGSALLGKPARLEIALQSGGIKREYHGIVVEGVRCSDTDGRPVTRLTIVPKLWRLTKRRDCRIFQEMSTKDIVTQVLDEAGVTDYEWSVTGSYDPRVFCCQYRESDFDFISRLLAEEGIIFTITHEDGSDTVVFGDEGSGIGDIEPAVVPFRTLQGFDTLEPAVVDLRKTAKVVTDKVFVRDYDFERPKYELEKEAESGDDGAHALEIYNFPGRFNDDGVAERYAQVLLDAIQSTRDVLSGGTSLLSMKPGFRFTVEEHPYGGFNKEWLIVSVNTLARDTAGFHEGDTTRDYECTFTAVPTDKTSYKALRRSATSDVPGAQTAVTTGASGSEIHPDEFGRVKVRFHWDRTDPSDDTSSCWVRTEQPNTPDSMLLPRVGWEVSVRFREGDVDQPICFGRMYNAVAPPPYALPDSNARSSLQTATSPGGGSSNELRFDDSGGSEEMFVNASKDLTIAVGNNMTLSIGNNEERTIGSNHTVAVTNSVQATVGSNQKVDVGSNQSINVETFMLDDVTGDHSLTIGAKRDMKVGGDHKHTVTGNQTQSVSSNQVDLVVGAIEEKADGNWTHDVGAALIELTTSNRDFTVAGSRSEEVGAVKLVATKGGRGVEVGGNLTTMVAGAIVHKVKGDKTDKSGGAFTDLVAGAQIIKADNVTFEGEDLVAVVMGASTLIISKPVILLAGTSVKWDGVTKDTAILVLDN